MTPEEFKNKMEEIAEIPDVEKRHDLADRFLCLVLEEKGYGEGTAIFRDMKKWYS